MLFTAAAAVFTLLPTLALSAPSPLIARQNNAGNTPGSNMCDQSSFNDGAQYHISPANANDCVNLYNTLDTYSTTTVGHSWSRLYTSGTCAFSVRVIAGEKQALVGGADAADLLKDSVAKYETGGYVAGSGQYAQIVSAEGEVDCDAKTGGTPLRVEWIISSTTFNPPN